MLPGAGQPGNRTAAQVSGQVNLGGQPAAGRPIASRPDFLSFAKAPRAVISGPDAAGSGRMLVRAGHRGIGADCPVLALGLITAGPQPVEDLLPGAIQ